MVDKRWRQLQWQNGQEQRAQHFLRSLRDERIIPCKNQGTGMMKVVKNDSWDATMLQMKEMSDPGQEFCLLMGQSSLISEM